MLAKLFEEAGFGIAGFGHDPLAGSARQVIEQMQCGFV
jgi:hypothetical protein